MLLSSGPDQEKQSLAYQELDFAPFDTSTIGSRLGDFRQPICGGEMLAGRPKSIASATGLGFPAGASINLADVAQDVHWRMLSFQPNATTRLLIWMLITTQQESESPLVALTRD